MAEYPSNSDRSREAGTDHRLDKVTSGAVSRRRKTSSGELGDLFLARDLHEVKDGLLRDILVPKLRRLIYDFICGGAAMLLGEQPSRPSSPGGRASYRAYYDSERAESQRTPARRLGCYRYSELIFSERGDAEAILVSMEEQIDRFDAVSVADMMDLAGETPVYTDYKFGWTNLTGAQVRMVQGGYRIQLPQPVAL